MAKIKSFSQKICYKICFINVRVSYFDRVLNYIQAVLTEFFLIVTGLLSGYVQVIHRWNNLVCIQCMKYTVPLLESLIYISIRIHFTLIVLTHMLHNSFILLDYQHSHLLSFAVLHHKFYCSLFTLI